MINYTINTFNVIVLIGKVEAKVEQFRRRSTRGGERRRKAFPSFNLLLITRSSQVCST